MVKKKTSKRLGRKPGRMLRPKARVLKDSALVPAHRSTQPPKTFTHELRRAQPYYYEIGGETPDGSLAAGTRVKLTQHHTGDEYARVVTDQGLRVATEFDGLRLLGKAQR